MSKQKKLTHDQKIVKALNKIKTPIIDKTRNRSIYFREQARSNETGKEHIAKSYHGLDPSDIELVEDCIHNPADHVKDKRYTRTYCYYHKRKHDKKHFIKVVVKIEKRNHKIGYISSIFISSKIKKH